MTHVDRSSERHSLPRRNSEHVARLRSSLLMPLLLFLLLLLPACGGGKTTPPDPTPPTTPDYPVVFPQAMSATIGARVRFITQDQGANATYQWDFDGGGIPVTSTEREPLVQLTSPAGFYTGRLTVCRGECLEPVDFVYFIEGPPVSSASPAVMSVAPTGSLGLSGDMVTFQADAIGTINTWSWDFGEGATPRLSSDPSPIVTLRAPRIYQGTVTVSQHQFSTSTFHFAYSVNAAASTAPPQISRILEDRWSYCANKPIAISALVNSDAPVTYDWQIAGGGAPPITTNSVVRFTSTTPSGLIAGSLRVSNAHGSSAPYPFSFRILNCPEVTAEQIFPVDQPQGVVYLKTSPNDTYPRKVLQLEAPAFAPKGLNYPDFSATRATSGPVSGHVEGWKTHTGFAGDPAPFQATLTHPQPVPIWKRVLSVPISTTPTVQMAIVIQGDRPLLFFNGSQGLTCATARAGQPQSDSDWDLHAVSGFGTVSYLEAFAGDGRPVIVAHGPSKRLQMGVAQINFPASSTDWDVFELPQAIVAEQPRANAMPDGRLVIMATPPVTDLEDPTAHPTIYFAGAHPTGPADILASHVFDAEVPAFTRGGQVVAWKDRWILLLRNFNRSRTFIACALTDSPVTPADWSFYVFDTVDTFPVPHDMVELTPAGNRLWACERRQQSIGRTLDLSDTVAGQRCRVVSYRHDPGHLLPQQQPTGGATRWSAHRSPVGCASSLALPRADGQSHAEQRLVQAGDERCRRAAAGHPRLTRTVSRRLAHVCRCDSQHRHQCPRALGHDTDLVANRTVDPPLDHCHGRRDETSQSGSAPIHRSR